tara:strand:+ start:1243 stop:2235 length:993 start_codon:yes stop_codon:yes gene_type:complete
MTKKPATKIDAASAATSHAAIETQLGKLQENGYLALHMFEHYQPLTFPEFSFQTLAATPAAEIGSEMQKIQEGQPHLPLLSCSIVPPDATIFTPYFENEFEGLFPTDRVGYLLDVSPGKKPHPARIARADMETLYSDYDPQLKLKESKTTRLDRSDGLKTLYKDKSPEAFAREVGAHIANDLSNAQLQAMSDEWEFFGPVDPSIRECNEVLVAGAPEHLSAIVVPRMHPRIGKQGDFQEAAADLAGGLTSLMHLKRNDLNLPLVVFDGASGTLQCKASGKQELEQLVHRAFDTLQASPEILQAANVSIAELANRAAPYLDTPLQLSGMKR